MQIKRYVSALHWPDAKGMPNIPTWLILSLQKNLQLKIDIFVFLYSFLDSQIEIDFVKKL